MACCLTCGAYAAVGSEVQAVAPTKAGPTGLPPESRGLPLDVNALIFHGDHSTLARCRRTVSRLPVRDRDAWRLTVSYRPRVPASNCSRLVFPTTAP